LQRGRAGRYQDDVQHDVRESIQPTLRSAVMLLVVFLAGTIGYRVLAGSEHGWLDALYMTTITLTTVGFEEAIPVKGRPEAEIFTVLLLVSGVGTFVYFVSNLTAFLVEGTLQQIFWRRHMDRWIGRLQDHHVICGGGHSGEVVVRELLDTGREFVVIEADAERAAGLRERLDREFPLVIGDAAEDDILIRAGIERARSLVSCIGGDKDNVVVVFTARSLRPNLRIVARCLDAANEAKLRRAGADAVVSPERIGGLRMVSESVRPTVVSFLDLMLRDTRHNWRVEEVTVAAGSALENATVADVRARGVAHMLLMAVRRSDGEWVFDPPDAQPLPAGTAVIFMGQPEARAALEQAATA
jgi:voltage-gated potassium channel